MTGDLAGGRRAFSGLSVSGYDCAYQRMAQPWPEFPLVRAVVVQVFMQAGCNSVFHSCARHVSGKPRAESFAESGYALSSAARAGYLPNNCASRHARHCALAKGLMLPAFDVGVPCGWVMRRCHRGLREKQHDHEGYPHARLCSNCISYG